MFCNRARICLHRYLRDELSPRQKKRIEDHLQKCPECRKKLETTRQFTGIFGSISSFPPVPEDFASRTVLRAIQENKAQSRQEVSRYYFLLPQTRTRLWRAAIAAAIVLGLGLGSFMGRATWQKQSMQVLSPVEKQEQIDPLATIGLESWSDSSRQTLSDSFVQLVSASDMDNKGEGN